MKAITLTLFLVSRIACAVIGKRDFDGLQPETTIVQKRLWAGKAKPALIEKGSAHNGTSSIEGLGDVISNSATDSNGVMELNFEISLSSDTMELVSGSAETVQPSGSSSNPEKTIPTGLTNSEIPAMDVGSTIPKDLAFPPLDGSSTIPSEPAVFPKDGELPSGPMDLPMDGTTIPGPPLPSESGAPIGPIPAESNIPGGAIPGVADVSVPIDSSPRESSIPSIPHDSFPKDPTMSTKGSEGSSILNESEAKIPNPIPEDPTIKGSNYPLDAPVSTEPSKFSAQTEGELPIDSISSLPTGTTTEPSNPSSSEFSQQKIKLHAIKPPAHYELPINSDPISVSKFPEKDKKIHPLNSSKLPSGFEDVESIEINDVTPDMFGPQSISNENPSISKVKGSKVNIPESKLPHTGKGDAVPIDSIGHELPSPGSDTIETEQIPDIPSEFPKKPVDNQFPEGLDQLPAKSNEDPTLGFGDIPDASTEIPNDSLPSKSSHIPKNGPVSTGSEFPSNPEITELPSLFGPSTTALSSPEITPLNSPFEPSQESSTEFPTLAGDGLPTGQEDTSSEQTDGTGKLRISVKVRPKTGTNTLVRL